MSDLRISIRMSDIIDSAVAIVVVRGLNIVTTHVVGFGAKGVLGQSTRLKGLIDGHACINLITATVYHVVGKFGIVVDCVVDGLDTVCVVHSESVLISISYHRTLRGRTQGSMAFEFGHQ